MNTPMYYRDLIGYPPAPAAIVEFALIHRDIVESMGDNGWRFISRSLLEKREFLTTLHNQQKYEIRTYWENRARELGLFDGGES